MNNKTIKRMFDACYLAKRTREMLPALPKGVMPSYIQYLDVIQAMEAEHHQVRVSDVSDAMNQNNQRDGDEGISSQVRLTGRWARGLYFTDRGRKRTLKEV